MPAYGPLDAAGAHYDIVTERKHRPRIGDEHASGDVDGSDDSAGLREDDPTGPRTSDARIDWSVPVYVAAGTDLTSRSGTVAPRSVSAVTLPSMNRCRPPRPCVAMAIRSTFRS